MCCAVCLCSWCTVFAQTENNTNKPLNSKLRVGLGLAGNDGFSSGWLLSASYVRPIDNLLEFEAGFSITHAVDAPRISPGMPYIIWWPGSAANQILVESAVNIHPLTHLFPGCYITGGCAYREMQVFRVAASTTSISSLDYFYQNIGELVAVFKIGVDVPITERLGLTMRVGAYGRSVPVDYARSLLFGSMNVSVGL